MPPTWPDGSWTGNAVIAGSPYLAAIEKRGTRTAVAVLPLNEETARRWAAGGWFDISFSTAQMTRTSGEVTLRVGATRPGADTAPDASPSNSFVWGLGRPGEPGFWHARRIVWFRPSKPPLDWETGKLLERRPVVALLRSSAAEAWADFTASPYQLRTELLVALGTVAAMLGVVYLLAAAFAVVQILAIARATARLTRGARAVAAGELSYRIPVTRRDQLGDLALAFNAMTAAVERMLHDVAEKERLKREMELAREIQQSLLPDRVVDHEDLRVNAHFRPASEVGGDYFDVFRLPDRRLLVAVGDIAGHGLSTGLLMAMVKSAMATLVQEGHRGAELLVRLNRVLLEQPVQHRMATVVVADIDPGSEVVEITSSGHPPAILVSPGAVTEVELHSLPLGMRLPLEPASRTLPFRPGCSLLLFTDGLVEAADDSDSPFGYEKLHAALQCADGAAPAGPVEAVLAALDRHLGGNPALDDLTVLAVTYRNETSA